MNLTPEQVAQEQAEDVGLWFEARTVSEAYLQQELRRLHCAIEAQPKADQPAAPAVEPVAWMLEFGGEPPGITSDPKEAELWRHEGYTLTPLYAAPPAPVAIPTGWKLVPIEPTDEMLAHVTRNYTNPAQFYTSRIAEYKAMLDAAPLPSALYHYDPTAHTMPDNDGPLIVPPP